jgi:hypothetical protein
MLHRLATASAVVGAALVVGLAAAGTADAKKCDSAYRGACLKPNATDYDCAGGSGDGPYYVSVAVRIVGRDHYRLDADGDGWGCEDH